MSRFSPRAIIKELRRRRVLNTLTLFIVGAWVALQVTELALPGLGISDAAIRYVWIGAFLLFPLVLLFAWRYDLSTGGIRRTPRQCSVETDTSLSRLDHAIITAFACAAVIVIGAMGLRISQLEPQISTVTIENSIAVLPFAVCENGIRDQELAGGLTMDVINRLAERGTLKVIARTSSYTLAGMGLTKREIAEPLGVQYLLSGEICRDGDELALSAELFDAQGFIVWSDHFARQVNQWNQVTDHLAIQVASGVAAQLGDPTPASFQNPVNPLAHEQLLIGRQYWANHDRQKAKTAFERALQHQPDYPEALAWLAGTEAGGFLTSGRKEGIAKARPILDQALAIAMRQLRADERSAEMQLLAGQLVFRLTAADEELAFRWENARDLDARELQTLVEQIRDGYAGAERHFRSAIALNPSVTEAYSWLSDAIERQDVERRAEALEILEAGQLRDPFNIQYNGRIAKRWAARGRYRQAIELMQRFKRLPEIPLQAWWWQLEIMQLQYYWDEKCETLIEMLRDDPGAFELHDNRWQIWWYVGTLAELGLFEEAEAWKQRLEDMPLQDWAREGGIYGYLSATGQLDDADMETDLQIAIDDGEIGREIERLETVRHERAMWHERTARDDLRLAGLYQLVDRQQDAASLLDEIAARLRVEYSGGIRHWETLYQLGEAYARQGRDEEALTMLRKSYDYHGLTPCSALEQGLYLELAQASPWSRFAEDLRYQSLCQRIDHDLEQQAQRIRDMLANHDVDDLLAPLMKLAAKTD